MTTGKKIGLWCFILTEIIIIVFSIWVIIENKTDLIIPLVTCQTAVMGITWGAKASSNFAGVKK